MVIPNKFFHCHRKSIIILENNVEMQSQVLVSQVTPNHFSSSPSPRIILLSLAFILRGWEGG